jgi:hypothetical protein
MAPHIIIVGADKGGVGKTTVSRTVLDYFKSKQLQIRAFDTEIYEVRSPDRPKGVLKRFHPDETDLINLTTSEGQMKVFDALAKNPTSLIDIRAGLLTPTLDVLEDIGLLEAVKAGKVNLTLMHVIGSSVASFAEIAQISKMLAGENAKHYLVMNHINDSSFFDWNEDAKQALALGDGHIVIPKLDARAAEDVESLGIPFLTYIDHAAMSKLELPPSMVLGGKARGWLKMVFAAYDDVLKI